MSRSWPTASMQRDKRSRHIVPGSVGVVRRVGTLVTLHATWAIAAGAAALVIGYVAASLIASLVPMPRRQVMAGGVTALAIAAGWAAPTIVGRMARRSRLSTSERRASDRRRPSGVNMD